jgi:hypothetical protein
MPKTIVFLVALTLTLTGATAQMRGTPTPTAPFHPATLPALSVPPALSIPPASHTPTVIVPPPASPQAQAKQCKLECNDQCRFQRTQRTDGECPAECKILACDP